MSLLIDEVLEIDLPVAKAKPEHWFQLTTSDRVWRFAWVDADTLTALNDGQGCYALTLTDMGIVLVDAALKAPKLRKELNTVVLHELGHIAFADLGAGTASRVFGRSEKASASKEEEVCTHHSVRLANPMALAGLFRLPRWKR